MKQRLHQTQAAMRFDSIDSEYPYNVNDKVMTIDGYVGRIVAIHDGPFRGNEEYEIVLDNDMGGGLYTSSQILHRVIGHQESNFYTADKDYPELGDILRERPDPAKIRFTASKENPGLSTTARILVEAAIDRDFRFHIMAAWKDVVAKAKRIRSEGGVQITHASDDIVVANVKGDTNVYETGIQRSPGSRMGVAVYSCGCKWGAYHWGADDDFSRFAGRMCSHALALQYEAQSQGMFGRTITVDDKKPSWVPSRVVVKYDIDDHRNIKARSSLEISPIAVVVDVARKRRDEDALSILAAVNDLFGNGPAIEPETSGSPLGATSPPNPNANPGSTGFATGPDPDDWLSVQPTQLVRDATKGDDGVDAELKDDPEAALPEATAKNWEYEDPSKLSPEMGDSNGTPTPPAGGVVTSVPSSDEIRPELEGSNTADEVERVIREFHKSAGAQALIGGLQKEALKDFSFSEQQELINEGMGKRARNLDLLDIKGTHYEYLEEEGEDQIWLA